MMSSPTLIQVTWHTRAEPLEPAGVVACDEVALKLASKMLHRTSEELSALSALATDRELVVLGQSEDLPWADGVCYVGRCPEAPALLLPTILNCTPHPQLVLARLLIELKEAPVLVCPPLSLMMSVAQTTMISSSALKSWSTQLQETLKAEYVRASARDE